MASFYPAVVTEKDVKSILRSCYQIESKKLTKMKGFDFINYKAEIISGTKYFGVTNVLLKISPCSEPPDKVDFLYEQIHLMQNLSHDLPNLIQNVYTSKDGKLITKSKVRCQKDPKREHDHNVTLFEFIEAIPMIEVLPFTCSLIEDVGRNFANVSKLLQKHATETLLKRTNQRWDPKNVLQCEEYLYLEKNIERKNLFGEFLRKFRSVSLPHIERLCTRALIHSDGSCNNILVQSDK